MLNKKIRCIVCSIIVFSGCGINTQLFYCKVEAPVPSYSIRNFQYYPNNTMGNYGKIRTKKEHVFMLSVSGTCQ
jgi:hypothetical protein